MKIPCKECVSIVKPMCGANEKIVCNELYEWIKLADFRSRNRFFNRGREIVKYFNITTSYINVADEKGNCYGWDAEMIKIKEVLYDSM